MCVHLLSTVNSDYVVPFRIVVHSFLSHQSPEMKVRWHLCERGLSTRDKAEIENHHADLKVTFVWHSLATRKTTMLPTRGRAVSEMYDRLLMPELLAGEVERLIYLDGDLLILDRIDALWDIDLDGAILGAVQDLAVPLVSSPMGLRRYEELGFSRNSCYFNAGVYVVDVDAWSRNEIGRRAMEYLDRNGKLVNLFDQDALNSVLQNRWKQLDYRWNISGGLAARMHYHPKDVDVAQLEQAIANPGIIHFSGFLKPWIYPRLGSRWADAYAGELFEVFPDHRLDKSLKARCFSFYDRELRRFLYPVEHSIWQMMRGF